MERAFTRGPCMWEYSADMQMYLRPGEQMPVDRNVYRVTEVGRAQDIGERWQGKLAELVIFRQLSRLRGDELLEIVQGGENVRVRADEFVHSGGGCQGVLG